MTPIDDVAKKARRVLRALGDDFALTKLAALAIAMLAILESPDAPPKPPTLQAIEPLLNEIVAAHLELE